MRCQLLDFSPFSGKAPAKLETSGTGLIPPRLLSVRFLRGNLTHFLQRFSTCRHLYHYGFNYRRRTI